MSENQVLNGDTANAETKIDKKEESNKIDESELVQNFDNLYEEFTNYTRAML
jgi:hypothetical protein